jgi:hypothetical protein
MLCPGVNATALREKQANAFSCFMYGQQKWLRKVGQGKSVRTYGEKGARKIYQGDSDKKMNEYWCRLQLAVNGPLVPTEK